MMVLAAAVTAYSWIVLGGSVLAALAGLLTWRLNFSNRREDKRQRLAKMDAELIRAEHEGWASLLVNLREQYNAVNKAYEAAVKERQNLTHLVEKLQAELAITRRELAVMRTRVQILERQQGTA